LSPAFQYLLRVLTAWVQATDEPPAPGSAPSGPGGPPPLPGGGPRADWWPSLCLELGVLLQVNPDVLRRHLVCELYNQGLDPRAEEVRGRDRTAAFFNIQNLLTQSFQRGNIVHQCTVHNR
jgi:hypothetical protein